MNTHTPWQVVSHEPGVSYEVGDVNIRELRVVCECFGCVCVCLALDLAVTGDTQVPDLGEEAYYL